MLAHLCWLCGIGLIVDKQCMTNEEGMKELVSLLAKNKRKI